MNHTVSLQRGDILLRSVFKDGGNWTYDPSTRNYRDPATGRLMSATTRLELRNEVVQRQQEKMRATTARLTAGELTPAAYERAMQSQIKSAQTQNYSFGRGGINALTDDDKAKIAANVAEQHSYLAGFRGDIELGDMSDEAILARAELYGSAGTSAYEQGKSASYGMPDLDQYPGSGDTACLSNCLCELSIEETEGGWNVTWNLDSPASGSCPDCEALASDWAPLFVAAE